MINRYRVSFEDRLIEPDAHGKWVKYDDVAEIEAAAQARAEQLASQSQELERIELESQRKQIAELTQSRDTLEGELETLRKLSEQSAYLLTAARARIVLHGHAPNCSSRYGKRVSGGDQLFNACDCELDEWMHEHG